MGVWDTALFASDLACDIRDQYRELLEDGVDDTEATRQTIAKYQESLDDPDDSTSAILALAVTQSKIGRLDPVIRDRALAAIERGGDLSIWAIDNPALLGKRKQVLEKVREQLTGPQRTRVRVKRPSHPVCGLVAGDVLALDLPGGPALLRVVRVHVHRRGETPCLEELQSSGTELPRLEILERLEAKDKDSILIMSQDARFFALPELKNAGWKEAGFRKVATIPERAGDSECALPSSGIRWSNLAARYLQRATTSIANTVGGPAESASRL
jgi:hypothetical protein